MSLNIKNQRVHDLAREASRRTGKSQTSVIEEALERLLESLESPAQHEARRSRVEHFLAEVDLVVTDEMRAEIRRAERELYDERGLPA